MSFWAAEGHHAGQVEALQEFLRRGGRLLLEHPGIRINFAPLAEVLGPPAERALRWDWQDPPSLGPSLLPSRGRLRGVRFTAFIDPAPEPDRMVLHVVNYNVTVLDENPGVVTPVGDLSIRLPLPEGWDGARAVVYDPDAETPQEVDCPATDGTAVLALPELRIYQMVELTRR